jgi:hypothetical protein
MYFGAAADQHTRQRLVLESLAAAVRPVYFRLLPIQNPIVGEAGPAIRNKSTE